MLPALAGGFPPGATREAPRHLSHDLCEPLAFFKSLSLLLLQLLIYTSVLITEPSSSYFLRSAKVL